MSLVVCAMFDVGCLLALLIGVEVYVLVARCGLCVVY